MRLLRSITIVMLGTLAACTSTAPRYESDPAADFGAYHSFAWRSAPRTAPPVHPLDSELLEKRVRTLATADLTARGFVADDAAPQFTLRSALLAKPGKKDGPSVGFNIGFGSFGSSSASSVSVGTSTQLGDANADLTLVLEVHDARNDELVWQGWSKVSDKIGDAQHAELEKAVRTILADFPPRAKQR